MFKLEITELGYFTKSYDINELWDIIISNPNLTYKFHFIYEPITDDEFLSLFLQETKRYDDYMRLYRAIKELLTIEDIIQ